MNERQIEAYRLGKAAGAIDFTSALQGLLAAHGEQIDALRTKLCEKDTAFLMALALTERGARLDKSGLMESKIAEGIAGVGSCGIERKFIARVSA